MNAGSDGGAGISSSIIGTATSYSGGGAGGAPHADPYGSTTHGGGVYSISNANKYGAGGGGTPAAESTGTTGGNGYQGVVIIRYANNAFTTTVAGDLALQSVASTAESAPTTGDIVMLIEDAEGTATINTDVKAYISRDGSAFSSAVTLVDEGDWGTNKRILAAHDVDISGITSGTSMKYKITTHNQSAGSKETKIHATSLAWA